MISTLYFWGCRKQTVLGAVGTRAIDFKLRQIHPEVPIPPESFMP